MNASWSIIFSFTFCLLIALVLSKRKKSHVIYDERQTAIRGIAYKYATFTGVLSGLAAAFLLDLNLLPMDGSFAVMTVSLLMITVYIIYMVMKGAYFGVRGTWKKWTALIFLVGLCNLITGAGHIYENRLTDGKLTIVNSNLLIGTLFILIVAAVLIQKGRERRDDD